MAKNLGIRAEIDGKDLLDAVDLLKDLEESIDNKYLKATLRRKSKPMQNEMKIMSPSSRLRNVIGATTAKSKTPLFKVGVVKNNTSLFPNISSFGLAGILEYGTVERYRKTKSMGLVTGRVSTGRVPKRKYAWLRQSWDSNVKELEQSTINTIIKKIERSANG
jgi:hypothetical protein